MAPTKRFKFNATSESGGSDDSFEKPSEEVKRKVAKRNNSQESKVEPSSSSSPSSPVPKEANDADKTDVTQKNPEVEKPQTNILDMNTQCLLEMLRRMGLSELCTMAEVNVQLKRLAVDVFAVNHRNVSLTSLADPTTGKYTLTKVRQLLYNFGHLIHTLTIDETSLDDREQYAKLLQLVHKYCVETVEKVVFLNQPSFDRLDTMILAQFLGSQIVLRDLNSANPGVNRRFVSTSQMTFEARKITQEQLFMIDDNNN